MSRLFVKSNCDTNHTYQQDNQQLSVAKVYTIHQINCKLSIIYDLDSIQNLISMMLNQVENQTQNKKTLEMYGRRIIQTICFELQQHHNDTTQTVEILQALRMLQQNWKSILIDDELLDGIMVKQSMRHQLFLIDLNKSEYLYYLIKGYNTLTEKHIFKMIQSNQLTTTTLQQFKIRGNINSYHNTIHSQIISLTKNHSNQTYLKIDLIMQFIKHTLLKINFCLVLEDFDEVFKKVFQLSIYCIRLIKKFYSQQIVGLIKKFKSLLGKAIKIYQIVCAGNLNKIEYLINLIGFLDRKGVVNRGNSIILGEKTIFKSTQDISDSQNSKTFVLKLAIRILDSWKSVHSKKIKQQLLSTNNVEINSHPVKVRQNTSKYQQQHQYVLTTEKQHKTNIIDNIEKQQLLLKNKIKRSISLRNLRQQNLEKVQIHSKIKIRRQIQDLFNKQIHKRNAFHWQNRSKSFLNNRISDQGIQPSSKNFKSIVQNNRRRSYSLKWALGMSTQKNKIKGITHQHNRKIQTEEQEQLFIQDYKQKLRLFGNNKKHSPNRQQGNQHSYNFRKSLFNSISLNSTNNLMKSSQKPNRTLLASLNQHQQHKVKLKL